MNTHPTCAERVERNLESRIEDLRKLWTAYQDGDEDRHADELGSFFEYGLCLDFVAPGTCDDQREGYFRYQLSWGGPSDEFRFFTNPDLTCHRVEYWFLDWFDGASLTLTGQDEGLLLDIWEFFREAGSADFVFAQSRED